MISNEKFVSILEMYIQKIKRDKHYRIDRKILFSDFIFIIINRLKQRVRAFKFVLLNAEIYKSAFIGKNVQIQHGRHFSAGKNLILEENVFINSLGELGVQIGNNVSIQRDSILICTGVIKNIGKGISLHDNVGINARVYIGGQGGVTIRENVIIGPDVKIFSENHNASLIDIPIKLQGETRKEVLIDENCWIGAGSILLAGVSLGKGCIVGAGSVVTKSFPENSIIGGIPARLLKSRI